MPTATGIGPFLQKARENAGFSRREAGKRLALHPKSIEAYEYGRVIPPPEVVLAMGELYGEPELSGRYCRMNCAIGSAYSFEILNNVDLSITGILLKLRREYREAGDALEKIDTLILNKRCREDFSEGERKELGKCLHRLLNLEHNIEVLKIRLSCLKWLDLRRLVGEHNSKCYRRGYISSAWQEGENETITGERRDKNAGTLVKESIMFYRQEPGFPQVAGLAEIH